MQTVTIEDAQARLVELVEQLAPGAEVTITKGGSPMAKLVGLALPLTDPRRPGSAKAKILYMADDFDAPLEDFKEYMG